MQVNKLVFVGLVMFFLTACGPSQDDAQKLGFSNVEELKEAKKLGANNADEYKVILSNKAREEKTAAIFSELKQNTKIWMKPFIEYGLKMRSSGPLEGKELYDEYQDFLFKRSDKVPSIFAVVDTIESDPLGGGLLIKFKDYAADLSSTVALAQSLKTPMTLSLKNYILFSGKMGLEEDNLNSGYLKKGGIVYEAAKKMKSGDKVVIAGKLHRDRFGRITDESTYPILPLNAFNPSFSIYLTKLEPLDVYVDRLIAIDSDKRR